MRKRGKNPERVTRTFGKSYLGLPHREEDSRPPAILPHRAAKDETEQLGEKTRKYTGYPRKARGIISAGREENFVATSPSPFLRSL